MIIEILTKIGHAPLRIDASQVVIMNDVGTPVCVAGEYGPVGALLVAHAKDGNEFQRALRAFGYNRPVTVETRSTNPSKVPSGAILLANPNQS